MSRSVRIHVAPDTVTATLWRGRTCVWEGTRAVTDDLPHTDLLADARGRLGGTMAELLRAVPRPRWGRGWLPRPAVTVVVGPHAAHAKRLRGLPAVPSARVLASAVRENARQFFLRDAPFVPTTLRRLDEGEAVGGAVDAAVLEAAAAACAETGYTLRGAHPEGHGDLLARLPHNAGAPAGVPPHRAGLAVAALGVALCAASLAPGLSARRAARRAARELASLSREERAATDARRDAARADSALAAVTRFERGRRPVTLLIAALDSALPPGSAISVLRVDTADVDVVVVAAQAAAVLGALDRTPGVVAPEIVGPVSREAVGAGDRVRELERATLRFRYEAADAGRTRYAIERGGPE